MSHDHGWRAACRVTIWILRFHFEVHEVARGVTAMVVGSGALLGRFFFGCFETDFFKFANQSEKPPSLWGGSVARVLATYDLTSLTACGQFSFESCNPGVRQKQGLQPNFERRRVEIAAYSSFTRARSQLWRIGPISDASHLGFDFIKRLYYGPIHFLRLTSKMSHDGTWRASCHISLFIPPFHLGITFHRTRRDKSRRWLWRLVRPFFIALA